MTPKVIDILTQHWKRLSERGIYTSQYTKLDVLYGDGCAEAWLDQQLADGSRTAEGVERVPVPDAFLEAIKGKNR